METDFQVKRIKQSILEFLMHSTLVVCFKKWLCILHLYPSDAILTLQNWPCPPMLLISYCWPETFLTSPSIILSFSTILILPPLDFWHVLTELISTAQWKIHCYQHLKKSIQSTTLVWSDPHFLSCLLIFILKIHTIQGYLHTYTIYMAFYF